MGEPKVRPSGSIAASKQSRRSSKPLGAKLKGMMKGIRKSKSKKVDSGSKAGQESRDSAIIQIDKKDYPKIIPPQEQPRVPVPQPEELKAFRSLQLVLLLMDPTSRRFELLQLEFDSAKARVADIIAQIPVSVTEAAIRQQSYEYVLDENANMRDQQTRLLDFCNGKQVLVAVPKGTTVKECVRLARPILCDPQVVKMLNYSGFSVSKWDKTAAEQKTEIKSRALPVAESEPSRAVPTKKEMKDEGKMFAPIIPVLALLALVLQTYHNIVIQPIQVGIPVAPGTFRSRCGLLSYFPNYSDCEPAYLEVNDDGTMAVFDAQNNLDMLLLGGVCATDNCVDGVLLEEDGKVYIGGKLVKTATLFDDEASLSPWPFKEHPKLKGNPFNKVNVAGSNI